MSRQIASVIKGMRSEIGCMREDLTRAGHRHPPVCNAVTDVLQRCMSLLAHVTMLETIAAAKRVVGEHQQLPKQESPESYELPFAAGREAELDGHRRGIDKRLLQTLHRAGDHTLDDEEPEQAGSLCHEEGRAA